MVNLSVIASGFMVSAHEHSYIGGELDLFALATNWKRYIKKEVSSYTTGDVLEVGAGIGATTGALHDGTAHRWICLEPDQVLALRLKAGLVSFMGDSTTHVIVGSLRAFSKIPVSIASCTLMSWNISKTTARRSRRLRNLSAGAVILSSLLRPIIGSLVNSTKASATCAVITGRLLRSMMPAGWVEEKLVYMDSVGVLLSLGNVLGLRQSMPTRAQIILWDRVCVPASRLIDRLFRGTVGKSVLAVWRKA